MQESELLHRDIEFNTVKWYYYILYFTVNAMRLGAGLNINQEGIIEDKIFFQILLKFKQLPDHIFIASPRYILDGKNRKKHIA